MNIFKEYDISLSQIYTITSDNGANMIKTIQLLHEELDENITEENHCDENILTEFEDSMVVESSLHQMCSSYSPVSCK